MLEKAVLVTTLTVDWNGCVLCMSDSIMFGASILVQREWHVVAVKQWIQMSHNALYCYALISSKHPFNCLPLLCLCFFPLLPFLLFTVLPPPSDHSALWLKVTVLRPCHYVLCAGAGAEASTEAGVGALVDGLCQSSSQEWNFVDSALYCSTNTRPQAKVHKQRTECTTQGRALNGIGMDGWYLIHNEGCTNCSCNALLNLISTTGSH